MVDRQGRDQAGEPVPALEGWPKLLQTAFDAPLNQPSLLEETDDGAYFVVEVSEIVEPRLKALDEVRDDVVTLYEEQQRRAGAKAKAEEIRARLQEAASFETIADDAGLVIETIEPVKRSADGAASGVSRAAIAELFTTDAGAVADEVIETEDGVLVLAVDEIIEKSATDEAEARAQLKTELERQLRADLLDQYGRALQDVHTIEIHEGALARLVESDGNLGYGGGSSAPQPIF
jgi:peptidyl-prolyl cis-trans isomerase D